MSPGDTCESKYLKHGISCLRSQKNDSLSSDVYFLFSSVHIPLDYMNLIIYFE